LGHFQEKEDCLWPSLVFVRIANPNSRNKKERADGRSQKAAKVRRKEKIWINQRKERKKKKPT